MLACRLKYPLLYVFVVLNSFNSIADSLNANCLISLIACVSLEADDHKENLRTLLLADVARSMKIEPESGATSGSVESELNSPSEKLGSVSPAGSEQTEEIVTKKTVELSTKPNVKNCIVVLKQCEVDSHERDKEPQKCEESEEPNDETTRTPPGTNSTVSISRLETPNPENKNHQRINTDEHTWTCFDDSCSIRYTLNLISSILIDKSHFDRNNANDKIIVCF